MVNFQNVMFYSRKCDTKTLFFDEACLSVVSDKNVSLWKQYTECEGCDYVNSLSVDNGTNDLLVRTIWPLAYKIQKNEDDSQICNGTFSFKEYGRYQINVTDKGCSDIFITEQPDEPLLPFLVAIVIMLSIATLWYLIKGLIKKIGQSELWNQILRRGESGDELLGTNPSPSRRTSTRLLSADVFRGITISLMILVNYGGGGYSQLRHAVWNGLTIADLVFPWFAWLMGMSLCLSLHVRLRTAMTRWTAFMQVLRRAVILICLGIVIGSKGRIIEELRLPGVLQRLGLAYLIVAGFESFAMNASLSYTPGSALFRDLHSTWKQWLFTLSLVALHLGITLGVAAPGCPKGYNGPGGLHKGSMAPNCTGGIAGYIDRAVFGPLHLYKGGTYKQLYESSVPYDPEGLLGTLTCVLVVQLGAQGARVLLAFSHARARVSHWIFWGVVTAALVGALSFFSKNDGPIPINKNLWSLSYCLIASSLAFFIQAFLYTVIDWFSYWGGRPFYYAGRNALLVYMGSELMKNRFPFEWKLQDPSHMQLLAMNSLALILWLTIAVFLHRKNVILTI